MNRLHVLALYLMLPLVSQATADTQNFSARYDNCLQSQQPINSSLVAACAEEVSEMAKKEMNRVYQRLYLKLQQVSQADAQELEEAQKAWLTYRNAHCSMQGKHVGSPMYYTCPMELNIDRVGELQFLLTNGG